MGVPFGPVRGERAPVSAGSAGRGLDTVEPARSSGGWGRIATSDREPAGGVAVRTPHRGPGGARVHALRTNVVDPLGLISVAARAAASAGGRLRVLVDPDAARYAELADLPDLPGHGTSLVITTTGRLPHDQLCSLVASAWACLLPYRFGTHSGWLELARDTGTAAVVPTGGHYVQQWPAAVPYVNDELQGLRAATLAEAVERAGTGPRPVPAERSARCAERDQVCAVMLVRETVFETVAPITFVACNASD